MNISLSSYENAQKYFSLSVLDKALTCIIDARKENPDDDKMLELHAKICYARKDYKEAEPLLRLCLQKDAANAAVMTRMIDILIDKQDYHDAISTSLQYLRRDCRNQDIQAQLADAYVANGQPEYAAAYLEPLTILFPKSSRNWYHLSKAYMGMQKYEEARLSAHHCLKINPTSKKALLLLADIYVMHSTETPGAPNTFALLCRPEFNELLCKVLIRENRIEYLELFCCPNLTAFYSASTIYSLSILSLEAEMFIYSEKIIEIFFQKELSANKTFTKYGADCFDRNDCQKALVCFMACYNHDPNNAYLVRYLGECLLRLGEIEKALTIIDEYKSKNQDNLFIEFLRAKILCKNGTYDEALQQISKCLRKNEYDFRYNSFAGYIYYQIGLMDLALKYTLISLNQKQNGNFYALNNLALISYKNRDINMAEKYLKKAVSECPYKITTRINLARVQIELGKLEDAYYTICYDLSHQISCNTVFDILSAAVEGDDMDLARRIIGNLPHDQISETDYVRLFRIVSGEFSKEDSYRHIDKYFWDDKIKNSHGVFLAEPMTVYKVLKDLSQFPHINLPAGIRKYRIPYERVGYKGGKDGDMHVLNFLTVLTAINEEYIITAYPSD